MVPYFPQPQIHLFGPVTLYSFGGLVALAVAVGWKTAGARCRKAGLDTGICPDLFTYVTLSAFVVAHLYSVLAYFPGEILKDPLILLKFWQDISSFGGIAGGVLGFWLYFRGKGKRIDPVNRWQYLDAIAYAFPFGWLLGRLGCTLAHDHPGAITTFPLGVSLATAAARSYISHHYAEAGRMGELPDEETLSRMAFHDLGLYEFLYTLLVMAPAFLLLGRKARRPGFFPFAFLLLYVPVRFLLDFLRLADARYAGLTPAQWAGAALFLAALGLAWRAGFFEGRRLRGERGPTG